MATKQTSLKKKSHRKWRLVGLNLWLFEQRKCPGPEGRYLPKVLQQIRSGNKSRVLESFTVPCCVFFSVLPTSSGAHLIPSSSLVELGLSGATQDQPYHHTLGWASLITRHGRPGLLRDVTLGTCEDLSTHFVQNLALLSARS